MGHSNRYLDAYQRYKDKPVKILIGLYRGNFLRLALAGVCHLIKHSPAWVMPIIIADIITTLTQSTSGTWNMVVRNCLILGGLVLLNIPMNYLHVHLRSTALRRVEAGLRSTIVEKLQHLSIPFHNEVQSGKLQSKVIRDVEAVQTLSENIFVSLIAVLINICVALIITAGSNLVVFLFFLLAIPVAAVTIRLFRKPIEKKNVAFRYEVERTSAEFFEMQEMITITRAHALEDVETERLTRQAHQVADEGYRLDIVQANFGSVSWAIFQFFQIATLMLSSYLSLNGMIPVGNVVLYQTYFTSLVNSVTHAINLFPMIAKGMESLRSIGEVLNSMDTEDYTGKTWLDHIEGSFRFNNVDFTYRGSDHKVLENFSLEVNPGETVAFVGESGAGKTTIINLLIGFMKPTSGSYLIDGFNTADLDFRSFRRHLSVVPQNSVLFSGTIRDNISYGSPDITDEEIMVAVRAASLEEFILSQPHGLDTYLTENGNNLSGGQRQRLSIARALVRKPQVILFDEATSALDSVSEKAVLEALDNLIEGRTAFIVAHRISTIRKADKIFVLDKGKIIEMGTYDELMERNGRFTELQNIQSGNLAGEYNV